jgi:DNA end-binding protein Ku
LIRKIVAAKKVRRRRAGNFGGMPRAIWSGAISFGLVNIPVKLYSAVSRKTVRFHQIDAESGQRIRQQRVNPVSGDEVAYDRIVKGYEIGPDRYVTITPEELESLEPQKSRTIDIEDFVELEEIDPIYFDHPYYLVPDTGAAKAYRLLVDAMSESGKVAMARVVLRSKEHLVAIRPRDGVLAMETMLFADEVISADGLDGVPDADEVPTSERELAMAKQLIDSLSSEFEPEKYRDEYRERVLDLIERKAQGETIVIEAAPEAPQKVPDLMAALEASIAGAGKATGAKKRSSPKKSPARKAGTKKTPAKT